MNLLELKERLDELIEECIANKVKPDEVTVAIAYQPNYPLMNDRVSLGVWNHGTDEKPKLKLYVLEDGSNGNGYAPASLDKLVTNLEYPLIDVIDNNIEYD